MIAQSGYRTAVLWQAAHRHYNANHNQGKGQILALDICNADTRNKKEGRQRVCVQEFTVSPNLNRLIASWHSTQATLSFGVKSSCVSRDFSRLPRGVWAQKGPAGAGILVPGKKIRKCVRLWPPFALSW